MSVTLLKILADFTVQLSDPVAVGDTTATLSSATDDDGVALPTGLYGLTIDSGQSNKEYIVCTLTGTALTAISNISRQGASSSGFARAHRRGAKVTVTDWAILSRILNNVNGNTGFNASFPLFYDGTATINSANQLATKAYADSLAILGAGNADTTTQGLVQIATQAEVDAGEDFGSSGAYVVAVPATSRARKYHDYAADSVGTDAYAITITPAITAYTAGQEFTFKAGTANTGACTLNVSGLGAKDIKKNYNEDLVTGDIIANQIVKVVYDGTNMQLVSKVSSLSSIFRVYTSDDTWTKPSNCVAVKVICIGAGGGGGGGRSGNATASGSAGGGGGAYVEKIFRASDLSSTVAVTVGDGGTAGSAGSGTGGNGESSSFGTYMTAYPGTGGGGGAGGAGGGAGGGSGGIGANADSSLTIGGAPAATAGANGISGQGAGGSEYSFTGGKDGASAEFGGAGGASFSSNASSTSGNGGSSLFGGAGGGGGQGASGGSSAGGGTGGAYGSYIPGGGGAAGTSSASPTAGTAGTSRSGYGCGDGGGGGGATTTGVNTGGVGGAGGIPGAGGGGGGGSVITGGVGGVGGRGEVRVVEFY